jgi:F420H(2)-dependent quinone reductase
MDATSRLRNWFGGTPVGVWAIKHLISPLDRRLYRRTGGRLVTPGHPPGPIVLLTTIGRRTGNQHTTPVFHLQDWERIILCNVTPHGEGANPWPLNLRAHPPGPGPARRPGPNLPGPAGHTRRARAVLAPAAAGLAGL